MSIGRHFDGTEMANECFGGAAAEERRKLDGVVLEESQQVVCSGAIAADGVDGGAQNMLVVIQPANSQLWNRNRLKTEQRRMIAFQLSVELTRQLFCDVKICTDPRPATFAILVIAQVPNRAA